MKNRFNIFLILILTITACKTPRKTANKGKEILNKHLEATGGKEKLRSIKSIELHGTDHFPQSKNVKHSIYIQYPDKYRSNIYNEELSMSIIYNSGRAIQIINGDTSLFNPKSKAYIARDGYIFFLAHQDKVGFEVQHEGQTKHNGIKTNKISLKQNNTLPTDTIFFDSKTNYVNEFYLGINQSIRFKNYNETHGIMYPFRYDYYLDGDYHHSSTLEVVKFNQILDEKLFEF